MKTFLSAVLLIIVLFVGCKKQSSPPPPVTEANATAASDFAKASSDKAEIEQKICPVMELPIDKDVFTVYQGKKVYFCCTDCKATFEKNPEKYLSKLPQFKK